MGGSLTTTDRCHEDYDMSGVSSLEKKGYIKTGEGYIGRPMHPATITERSSRAAPCSSSGPKVKYTLTALLCSVIESACKSPRLASWKSRVTMVVRMMVSK